MSVKKWRQTALLIGLILLIISLFSSRSLTESGKAIPANQRKAMPDFTYPQVDGSPWRLSDHRGDVVLLNFWAPWCPPCRTETPAIERVQQRLQAKGFTVAGVDVDGDARAAESFAKRFHVGYALLLPPPGARLVKQIDLLPTSFLLDRHGRIARSYVGAISESTLTADVNLLLQEPRNPT